MKQWREAAKDSDCIVIGYINLDICKWEKPDQINVEVVEITKNYIQTLGFTQMVRNITRAWNVNKSAYSGTGPTVYSTVTPPLPPLPMVPPLGTVGKKTL